MLFNILRDICRPQWFDIILVLKKSGGCSVGDIATALDKSYMGIKQHCESMRKIGYVDTWRKPRKVGRPEKIYRLTAKINGLFPQAGNELALSLLTAVGQVHGANAPEKLLFNHFRDKGKTYLDKIRGKSVVERATALAKLRDIDGYMSRCAYDKEEGFRILEYHNPLSELMRTYPMAAKAEERMIEQVLGAKVMREEIKSGGQTVNTFRISTL